MATTYTGNPANITPSAAPTETLPSDGDALAVAGINPTLQKLLDFIASIFNSILNGFAAPIKLANQTIAMPAAGLTTAITLGTGWNAFGSPAYWKDAGGVVHLRGRAQYTTGAATQIFTLPAGFRPASTRYYTSFDPTGTGPTAVEVDLNGVVVSIPLPANNLLVMFDGVTFLAEQ